MWAIIGFIVPWLLLAIHKKKATYRAISTHWILFLFPLLTILSTIWSDDPKWTLKASLELFLTIAIGIMAASCIQPRRLIAATLSAFLITTVLCVLTSWGALVSNVGDTAHISGIFGSKNAFSDTIALLMLVCIAAIADKGQAKTIRIMAFMTLLISPALLYAGHSLGAMAAVIMTMTIFAAASYSKRLPHSLRMLTLTVLAVFIIIIMLASFLMETNLGQILTFFGKDATLTGRTYLWEHAFQYIGERPILGTGYGAFWRIQNSRAQELWYAMHVPPGAGFNFHNEYLESLVELGIVGCTLLVSFLAAMTKKALSLIALPQRTEQPFAFIMYIFFIVRSPVEVRMLGQFNIGMILFCIIWIYLKPTLQEKQLPKPPANFYVPPAVKV